MQEHQQRRFDGGDGDVKLQARAGRGDGGSGVDVGGDGAEDQNSKSEIAAGTNRTAQGDTRAS